MIDMEWGKFAIEVVRVAAAAFFCGVIGLERQYRMKNAGFRTHALVGLGACLFTLIGMHQWLGTTVPQGGDPMRVAAQVVTGIGFLGAGVIFVNRDVVRGLTTAASIWVSASIGMASGAGMIPLAATATAIYLLLMVGLTPLVMRMPTRDRHLLVRLTYEDGSGTLRRILTTANEMEFETGVIGTRPVEGMMPPCVEVIVRFKGGVPLKDLIAELSEVEGVRSAQLFEDTQLEIED